MRRKSSNVTAILLMLGIMLLIAGIGMVGFTTIFLNLSDAKKDLTEYEYTYGFVDYKKRSSDDGNTYAARVTYYIDGEEYTWVSDMSTSKTLSAYPEYSSVKVYYKLGNPSDNAVPEIAAEYDKTTAFIQKIGMGLLIAGLVIILINIIKWIIGLVVLGALIGASQNTNNSNNYYPQNNTVDGLGAVNNQNNFGLNQFNNPQEWSSNQLQNWNNNQNWSNNQNLNNNQRNW